MSEALKVVLFVLGYVAIGVSIYSLIYINIDQMEGWSVNEPMHVIPSVIWPLALILVIIVGTLYFPFKVIGKLGSVYAKFLKNKRQTKKASAWKKKNDAEFNRRSKAL
jgi:hypothetical protein